MGAEDDIRPVAWNQDRVDALLDTLAALPLAGGSRGGPHTGITHNEVTRELLSYGPRIVPLLVARLPASGFNDAVYLVFLLRELRATEARAAVKRLQAELPRRAAGHDLTLQVQVEYFLRDT